MGFQRVGHDWATNIYTHTHTHTHTHTYICQGVLKHYIPYLMNQSLTRLLGILVLVSHSVRKQRMAATEPPTSSGLLPCQPPLQGPQDSCHKVLLESAPRWLSQRHPSWKIIQQYQCDLYRHLPIICTFKTIFKKILLIFWKPPGRDISCPL